MEQQNPLEKILYGDLPRGKKFFSQFRKESGILEEQTSTTKKNRTQSSKDGKDLIRRMGQSYRKRQRDKKIQKLSDNPSHWRGLN